MIIPKKKPYLELLIKDRVLTKADSIYRLKSETNWQRKFNYRN